MGVAGDKVAHTPNLDALMRESVRFTNAYCSSPVCGPSRASIMTGQYTFNLETRRNNTPFSPKHKTVAHRFGAAGYLTALVGKMHFVDGQTHGFDYKLEFNDWYQQLGPKTSLWADELGHANSGAGLPEIDTLWQNGDPWKGHRTLDGRLGSVAVGRPSLLREEDHFESFVARESIRFLENYAGKNEPFFLVSSFLKPHDPFTPAERFASMFDQDKMQLPDTWKLADIDARPKEVREYAKEIPWTPELKNAAESRKRMAMYYANLAQMDDCAGQILSALKRLGMDRNTIVVYTSDHGEMLGDLGLWNKFEFYEGSCGVPLSFRVPGEDASTCAQPVSLISLTATLADLCTVPFPGPGDGKSFAELVKKPDSSWQYGPVFAEYNVGEPSAKYMVRDGDYKYTFWTHDIEELYDLRNDPQERHNLARQPEHHQRAAQMKQVLFAWHYPAELKT